MTLEQKIDDLQEAIRKQNEVVDLLSDIVRSHEKIIVDLRNRVENLEGISCHKVWLKGLK